MPSTTEDKRSILDDAAIILLLSQIYRGIYRPDRLPEKLYLLVLVAFEAKLTEGFGGTELIFHEGSDESELFLSLKDNLRIFAAAKVFDFVLSAEGLMVRSDEIVDYKIFKKEGSALFKKFFESWQVSEEETAKEQARSVRDEIELRKTLYAYPIAEFVATLDERTCEVCGPRDGVRKPINDVWWTFNSPPLHPKCRCYKKRLSHANSETPVPENAPKKTEWLPYAYKTGEVFSKLHPYFTEIPKKYLNLAKKNFGLPTE